MNTIVTKLFFPLVVGVVIFALIMRIGVYFHAQSGTIVVMIALVSAVTAYLFRRAFKDKPPVLGEGEKACLGWEAKRLLGRVAGAVAVEAVAFLVVRCYCEAGWGWTAAAAIGCGFIYSLWFVNNALDGLLSTYKWFHPKTSST